MMRRKKDINIANVGLMGVIEDNRKQEAKKDKLIAIGVIVFTIIVVGIYIWGSV